MTDLSIERGSMPKPESFTTRCPKCTRELRKCICRRKSFKPPSGPVTPDYRRGIEDAARMMEEWATVAKGEKRIAYDNARIGILAMLGQMERSTK